MKQNNHQFLFSIPKPNLQIDFSNSLLTARRQFLQQALLETVAHLDIAVLDQEAHEYVPATALKMLAGRGLRAELVFALPSLLHANPRLLGYYRLLLGFSQKVFYKKEFGLSGGYQNMENEGKIDSKIAKHISELCRALNQSAAALLASLAPETITSEHLDDLTLLTFGPQLRGSRNVEIGVNAVQKVFEVIKEIVGLHVNHIEAGMIALTDATGRQIEIKFSSDPDIEIVTVGPNQKHIPLLAIEVKGGTDLSNAHNRLGEAEKSHLKAKAKGFTDLWTIVNVEGLSDVDRRAESPTTTAFFDLGDLIVRNGSVYEDFRERLLQKLRLPQN